jgi:negative regulator of sigma E activity
VTRKDYQLIADVLRQTDLPNDIRNALALNFAQALKRDNPRFKPVRFCMATMPRLADSEAIKANNAKGFERTRPDGTIEHWRPVGK